MARPIPRLEPVTNTVSAMRRLLGCLLEKGVRIGWTVNIQARFGVNTRRFNAAMKDAHALLVVEGMFRLDAQTGASRKRVDIASVVPRTQQKSQLHRPLFNTRAATGPGGDRLRHQLHAHPRG